MKGAGEGGKGGFVGAVQASRGRAPKKKSELESIQ